MQTTETEVIGRLDDDSTEARAACAVAGSVSVPFAGAAVGEIHAVLLESRDVNGRGGCVLQITLRNDASSFLPFAKNIEGGVELHMAGETEGQAFISALRSLLALSS